MKRRDTLARIRRRARKAGLEPSGVVVERLAGYYELLYRWNLKINLTALDDMDAAIDRLLVEPLAATRLLDPPSRLLDVGSGGGSPAIPMKVSWPECALWMVESKTRKSAFLREAARTLTLGNVVVETCRYEELLPRADLHESMDLVSLRAVRAEPGVLARLQAFVRPGGCVAWFRGPSGRERADMVMPPLQWEATYPLVESLRSRLVVLRKTDVGR